MSSTTAFVPSISYAPRALVAKRGYVLVRPSAALPSAIVQKGEALEMQRRFGGVLVPVSGLRYRLAQRGAVRVVLAEELPEVKRRYEAAR